MPITKIAKKKMAVYRQLTWNFLTESVYLDTETLYKKMNDFRTILYGRLRDFDDENVSPALGDFKRRKKSGDLFYKN